MNRKYDFTNQKIGKLTVIEYTEIKKSGYRTWLCKCECGSEINATTRYLISTGNKSCGCINNLVGKKFNCLTVIEKTNKTTAKNQRYWICKCDCGNLIEVVTSSIKSGKRRDCGCGYSRFDKSLIGKKFGFLTIIDKSPAIGIKNHLKYRCQCDCENKTIKDVYLFRLKSGNTVSCGCRLKRGAILPKLWKGYGEIPGRTWYRLKYAADFRKIEFNISIEYAWKIFLEQNKKCKYTGLDIEFKRDRKDNKYQTASLDRIDSSQGYIEGNIQWVHKIVNIMKWQLLDYDFINICNLIIKNKKDLINDEYEGIPIWMWVPLSNSGRKTKS